MALVYGAQRSGQGREDAALGQRVAGLLTQANVLSGLSLVLVESSALFRGLWHSECQDVEYCYAYV